jgi:hypothetical protein
MSLSLEQCKNLKNWRLPQDIVWGSLYYINGQKDENIPFQLRQLKGKNLLTEASDLQTD